jgi:hypothetical protein
MGHAVAARKQTLYVNRMEVDLFGIFKGQPEWRSLC